MCNCCWLAVCIVVVVLCVLLLSCVYCCGCLVCIVIVVLCVLLLVGRVYCCSCLVCNCWLAVCIVVVVLCVFVVPATSTQVFLGFSVSISKCSDGSQHSKLPLHASHVALQT